MLTEEDPDRPDQNVAARAATQRADARAAAERWARVRPSYGRVLAHRLGNERFVARVLSWHHVVPYGPGELAMCCCGSCARLCGYINLAHQVLGHQVQGHPRPASPLAAPRTAGVQGALRLRIRWPRERRHHRHR